VYEICSALKRASSKEPMSLNWAMYYEAIYSKAGHTAKRNQGNDNNAFRTSLRLTILAPLPNQ
jgi:hypothetical protein